MSFLDEEPPPGYIAGLGRGATGFSTQADLGSSSRVGYGNREGSEGDERFEDERFEDAAEENEEMIGYVGGAVEEDDEADKVFEEVERRLKRRKTRKKEGTDEGSDKNKDGASVDVTEVTAGQSIKAIGEKFQESKQALASVSNEEWANLPESGDFTRKTKRRREQMQMQQRFYRNSDSVTIGLRDSGSTDMSAIGGSSENVDIAQISLARDRVLAGQLSKMKEDGTDGSVDKSAYLNSLSGSFVNNIGDYSRTRSMFAKMRRSEPYKAQNWIASARLEMEAKKPKRAKELISEGCLKCPKSVEVWLVSLEIHSGDVQTCKVVIADAVKHNPRSVELWLEATKLENDRLSKKRVLMKALEFIPKSAKLWLELSGCEDDTEMQIQMLKKSTELIPESVGLWLKLASLEDVADARDTFNRARKAVNSDDVHTIWISAAKLEEKSTENEVKVTRLVEKCFQVAGNSLDRYEWLHEAVIAEKDGYPLTSRAIVFNCINIGMEEEEDVAEVWKKDALGASNNGSLEVARSIYMFMTSNRSDDTDGWLDYIDFERRQGGDLSGLYVVYEMAIQACPHYSQFYLMYAKDKWVVDGDTDRAKEILSGGLELNPQTEDLWFALAKLQWKTGERDECIQTFIKCRDTVIEPTARAWYKQVTLERVLEHYSEALDLIDEGLQSHPSEPKLYLQMGEVYESLKQWDQAKDAYEMGTKACKSSTLLWVHLARVYNERLGKKKIKARSTLEEAMALNPKDDLLYLERLDLEGRGTEAAQVILSKGLKEIPKSAILWAERIRSSRPQQRKNLYSLALNNTNDNPIVILAVARDLWTRGKLPKAKQFFDACLSKDPDFGDAYVYYHWFLEKHGEIEEVESLEKQFIDNDPHHGSLWSSVLKNISNIDKDSLHLLREAADEVSGEITNGSATKSTDAA